MTPDKSRELHEIIDEVVRSRVDANRRFVDEMLERIQDQNHRYFLEKLGYELRQLELEEKAGNVQRAAHHRVMADMYKSILERCFC